jgi:CheY-specific phosphatase CheX
MVEVAAREVLETTAGAQILAAATAEEPQGGFDGVIATISLCGTKGGTLVIYCPRDVAAGMTKAILGMEGEEPADDTIIDAMGEIANQVGGTLKRKMGASGSEIMLSVPVVVSASPISHHVKSTAKAVCVEMTLNSGMVGTVYVCLWEA